MATLRLASVTQFAPGQPAAIVQDVSFTIPDGQFWVVVGPSGCGKSTLLRLIAGLLPVSSGDIFLGKQRINLLPARQRDVAMVFQNYALYPHMTVAQNLGFGLKMRGLRPEVRSQQVTDMAVALGLEELLTRKPAQLSGGQQQRVALGRALVRQSQVFLLDEPLSNLDAQLRDETRAELKQLHQRFGVTTLYVTHDQTEAMTLADQIIVLDQGKVQQIGPPLQVYAEPETVKVATLLGTPPINLLTVQYRQQQLWLGQHPVAQANAALAEGVTVLLGIRPEQIQPSPTGTPLKVTATEPLGREVIVRGDLADRHPVCFFVPLRQCPQPGDALPVLLGPPVLLFEPDTGNRIKVAALKN